MIRIASLLTLLVAMVLLGRLAVYMVDADQPGQSLRPSDHWLVGHSCLTAYTEGARFASDPDRNPYDPSDYMIGKDFRHLGKLKVDAYEYPPPFLLVPAALGVAGDFFVVRPIWFALQLAALVAGVLLLARWIGGRTGALALYAAPLYLIAPTTLFSLQMGNFQPTVIALAVLGMLGLSSSRPALKALGATALAYAMLGKIFPALLGVYLLVARRWRAALWTAGAGLVLLVLTLLVFGTHVFGDFVHYQLPRLSSGEAFPQTEWPWIAAMNDSVYGLTVKLRALGVSFLDPSIGLAIASIYGFAVVVLAGAVGWRDPSDRLSRAQLWIALLDLGSFRSPFIGGAYAYVGTAWLVTLLLAGATTVPARVMWGAFMAVFAVVAWIIPTPPTVASSAIMAVSLASQMLMIGINVWVCARVLRRRDEPRAE